MSNQEKLRRVCRVSRHMHLSYETFSDDGSISRKELPFVLGIIGDFSGNGRSKKTVETNCRVLDVTAENFGTVLAQSGVGIELRHLNEELLAHSKPLRTLKCI